MAEVDSALSKQRGYNVRAACVQVASRHHKATAHDQPHDRRCALTDKQESSIVAGIIHTFAVYHVRRGVQAACDWRNLVLCACVALEEGHTCAQMCCNLAVA